MKLYRTLSGIYVESQQAWYHLTRLEWTALVTRDDLVEYLSKLLPRLKPGPPPDQQTYLAPIESGEIWAAGVTYYRSRTARMEESQAAGGGSFYDRVYEAERPELFFKSTPHRTVGHRAMVHIRSDARWSVPEPELALVVTPNGKLLGYSIGNDMSSRDIEGENPLYLPQAKVYERSCALGPCVLLTSDPLLPSTPIQISILRDGMAAFQGETTLAEMKRQPSELIAYLMRENSFPNGCVLLTGTGIIPPDHFTLALGDEIQISIPPIGTLTNSVD